MKILIIGLVILISGCATVSEMSAKSDDEIAKAADMWCVNVPESLRLVKRDAINRKTQIAVVSIDCPATVTE